MYTQALIVYERYVPKTQQGPTKQSVLEIISKDKGWVDAVIGQIDAREDELVFRTICVIIEAFAPMLQPHHVECLASIGLGVIEYLTGDPSQGKAFDASSEDSAADSPILADVPKTRPSPRSLLVLEALLERGPRVADWALVSKRIQGKLTGHDRFWKGGWVAHCRNARFVGSWVSFVRIVLLTSEALSAELLRMLLVGWRCFFLLLLLFFLLLMHGVGWPAPRLISAVGSLLPLNWLGGFLIWYCKSCCSFQLWLRVSTKW